MVRGLILIVGPEVVLFDQIGGVQTARECRPRPHSRACPVTLKVIPEIQHELVLLAVDLLVVLPGILGPGPFIDAATDSGAARLTRGFLVAIGPYLEVIKGQAQ